MASWGSMRNVQVVNVTLESRDQESYLSYNRRDRHNMFDSR